MDGGDVRAVVKSKAMPLTDTDINRIRVRIARLVEAHMELQRAETALCEAETALSTELFALKDPPKLTTDNN